MQYLKEYSEELYKYINNLHYKKRKSFFGKIKKKLNKLFNKEKIISIENKYKDKLITNALKFMDIDKESYYKNVEETLEVVRLDKKYNNQKEADTFWYNDELNKKWLSLNIEVQLNRYNDVYTGLCKFCNKKDIVFCDYGCGSAALSFIVNDMFRFKRLDLFDIKNYSAEFVKWYIENNSLKHVNQYDVIKDNDIDVEYDVIICLDVLEHLENCYDIFIKFYNQLKIGSLLFLRIAFEVEDKTHLPQAAENFFLKNNGWRFLNEHFKLIHDFPWAGLIINGVYQKIK